MPRPPHPRMRRQPKLLRRIFNQPQPVLDELRARRRPGPDPVRMVVVVGHTELRELSS